MFDTGKFKVYVKTNDKNYIVSVSSDGFLSDTDGWIEIDEGTGDPFYLAQNNYFPKPIMTESGAYQYKMVSREAVECSREEMEAQENELLSSIQPSQLDIIEAQVTYTAMMTNTLLEA